MSEAKTCHGYCNECGLHYSKHNHERSANGQFTIMSEVDESPINALDIPSFFILIGEHFKDILSLAKAPKEICGRIRDTMRIKVEEKIRLTSEQRSQYRLYCEAEKSVLVIFNELIVSLVDRCSSFFFDQDCLSPGNDPPDDFPMAIVCYVQALECVKTQLRCYNECVLKTWAIL